MEQDAAGEKLWTRRMLLFGGVSGIAAGAPDFRAEWRRYPDPSTDLEVMRLTDPAHASLLPAPYNRPFARRNTFLLYSSNQSGAMQVHRLDLNTGESRQLTAVRALDPATVCLTPDERSYCYFDGAALRVSSIGGSRTRDLYSVPEGWERSEGAHLSLDGQRVFFGERQGAGSRLRAVATGRGTATTIVQTPWTISEPVANPRRAQVLFRNGAEALWVASLDGKENRRLRLADGAAGPARWSPDGKAVLYLNFPAEKNQLNSLREHIPDENTDKLIGRTSQFVHFGCNSDSSVFVGASRNSAAPYVLILLRVTRRELALCEHRASDAKTVAPVFSPDSQRIYFQSDRHGNPAIYCMRVEKFVEMTEDEVG
jgi:oligogalacturonide lyase